MPSLGTIKLIGLGLLALAAGFLWLRLDAVSAERDLANQKVTTLEADNKAWAERERDRQAFQAEVRAGIARLTQAVAEVRATNETFRRRVDANENSRRPLDPAELDALKLFVAPAGPRVDKAGADPVRPAQPPAPVRGPAGRQ